MLGSVYPTVVTIPGPLPGLWLSVKELACERASKYWKTSCGYNPDCQCAFDLLGVYSHWSCLLLFTAKSLRVSLCHCTLGWAAVEVEMTVTIMFPITETHFSVLQLQERQKGSIHAPFRHAHSGHMTSLSHNLSDFHVTPQLESPTG